MSSGPRRGKSAQGGRKARKSNRPKAPDAIQEHPLAMMGIAFGAGVLLANLLLAGAQKTGQGAGTRRRETSPNKTPIEPAERSPRTHDTGAADMEFQTRHPDGKKVEFRFAWKKRPVDAPETDWETDRMGFTADHQDGKNTSFDFTRKTRPRPVLDDESAAGECRPGLGQATMEFVSSRPGEKDFRFTWTKAPGAKPAAAGKEPARATNTRTGRSKAANDGRSKRNGGIRVQIPDPPAAD